MEFKNPYPKLDRRNDAWKEGYIAGFESQAQLIRQLHAKSTTVEAFYPVFLQLISKSSDLAKQLSEAA